MTGLASPRVSIITGLYNSARYLDNYFAALDEQTFTDWEAVLVDDGSTDDTIERVRQRATRDPRIRLIQKAPEGYPSRTRQVGVEASVGTYVAFCDHDDFWAPQKLAMQVQVLDAFPDTSILHTDRVVWKTNDRPPPFMHPDEGLQAIPVRLQKPEEVLYQGLRIIFSALMSPRRLVVQSGLHPEMLGVDDYYLFLRLASLGTIRRIDLPLTYYAVHETNLSYAQNIFVKGLYQVHEALKRDDVPEDAKRAVLAQAYRTEAVSLFASDRRRALHLLIMSLRSYFIPSTLNRLAFLLATAFVPLRAQRRLVRLVKKIKFVFPTARDVITRFR